MREDWKKVEHSFMDLLMVRILLWNLFQNLTGLQNYVDLINTDIWELLILR